MRYQDTRTPPKGKGPVAAWPLSTTLLAALALVVLGGLPWYTLNLTASAPRGVWLRSPVPPALERGMWVILPVPAVVKRWGPSWGIPLLKPVAAVAGERVCVEGATLWIRGIAYGPVYTQAQGQPVPHLGEGCFEVEAGRVFLASQAAQSLDSRYYGSIEISALIAVATPLLVWR